MNFHIREMVEGDYAHVRQLLEDAGLMQSGELSQKAFRKLLRRNEGLCFVGQEPLTNRVVGCVFGSHDGALLGYIQKLAVNPDFQSKSLGKRLAGEVVKAIKGQGIAKIFALVRERNDPAIKLFESLGFNIRETHRVMDNF